MSPSDVIESIRQYGEPELEQFIAGLCGPCAPFVNAPLDALLRLAEVIAQAIDSKTELGDMRAAVQATNVAIDAAEAEALKLP